MSFNDSAVNSFALLADNEVITVHDDGIVKEGTRLFDDPDEFLSALVERVGRAAGDQTFRHELAHYNAARSVGIVGIRFGFSGEQDPGGTRYTRPFVRVLCAEVPKLAFAAMIAAPIDPSTEDRDDIRRLGYAGVIDVGDRIYGWNSNATGIHIPAPLSYSPGMPGSRFATV